MQRQHEREKWSWKRLAIELLVMALIGLVFGFLGPFGTYAMPTGMRLTYWVVFILVGYVVFRPISICASWLAEITNLPEWIGGLMASAIAALPLGFFVSFTIAGMRFDPDFLGERFFILYLQCAMVGYGIFALMILVFGREDGDVAMPERNGGNRAQALTPSASPPAAQTRTALHERLPTGFPTQILALGVEDHYVRVHAPDQSDMILMRLSDAIAEVSELEGLQVHRSWWVAKDAIMTSKREGRNLRLILSNGLEVPVSRSNVGKLKQTGWI